MPQSTINDSDNPLQQLAHYVDKQAQRYLAHEESHSATQDTGARLYQRISQLLALCVGGFSAYYYLAPANEAGKYLVSVVGLSGTAATTLQYLLAGSCTIVNSLLGAQCLSTATGEMFKQDHGDAYKALCPPLPLPKRMLRSSLTLFGAAGYAAPAFALSQLTGQHPVLTLLITLSNIPVGFVGVDQLVSPRFKPSHPLYRKIFLSYLSDRISDIWVFYEKKPGAVVQFIEEIKQQYASEAEDQALMGQDTSTRGTRHTNNLNNLSDLLEQLLTFGTRFACASLTNDLNNPPPPTLPSTPVIKATPITNTRGCIQSIITAMSLASIGGYVWSAGNTLDQASVYHIGANVCLAFLSLVSMAGLAYASGQTVGKNMGAGHPSIAHSISPKMHTACNMLIVTIAIFSGGSNFKVNKRFIEEFPSLGAILTNYGKASVKHIYSVHGLLGAPIVNCFYSAQLVNEVLVFFSRCFNEQIHRYLAANQFFQSLHHVFSEMAGDHFDSILKQLLSSHHPLANVLFALFKEHLPGSDYQAMLEQFSLPDPTLILQRIPRSDLWKTPRAPATENPLEEQKSSFGLRRRNNIVPTHTLC